MNKEGADKVMVEAAEADDEPEGPSDDQRIADLEAKVDASILHEDHVMI